MPPRAPPVASATPRRATCFRSSVMVTQWNRRPFLMLGLCHQRLVPSMALVMGWRSGQRGIGVSPKINKRFRGWAFCFSFFRGLSRS